jgi:hypothetical protein
VIERSSARAEESPSGTSQSPLPASSTECADLSAAQLAELTDEAKQAEYQRQFELQMRRRHCPGCGE